HRAIPCIAIMFSMPHPESGIGESDVGLDFFERDLRAAGGIPLRTGLDRERKVHAVNELVGAELGDALAHRSADELLRLGADLEVGVGIEVVINNVAVLQRDFPAKRL